MMVNGEPGYRCKILGPLSKVFADEEPTYLPECALFSGLWGETISFQFAYLGDSPRRQTVDVRVKAPDELSGRIRLRQVLDVPVGRATNGMVDDNYLRTTPGMYPDLLRELAGGKVDCCGVQWRSIWVDVLLDDKVPGGTYPIEVSLELDGAQLCSQGAKVEVVPVALPPQRIRHTEWFYADCLADYYHVEVFSEEHWALIEHYVREMVERGCNMILTPLFTPPLDVAVGRERTTVQLVDVEVVGGEYRFGFDKLLRWVDVCMGCGMRYLEMSHLFSQWGAAHPPKVVAKVDGKLQKIFGWDTPAVGEYTRFLHALLPQLVERLKAWNVADVTYFHVSDEPGANLAGYKAARDSLGDLLEGFHTLDAISSYDIYAQGIVDIPVPDDNMMDEFIANRPPELWTYYCTGQYLHGSNRFMAMPSARNRIIGVLCYKFGVDGFLHWGYNYYCAQLASRKLNPYQETDAGGGFPSGDAFLVYPGEDGYPEESIRMMVLSEAFADIRALDLLESLAGRDYVLGMIDEGLAEPVSFSTYPKSDVYLMQLRNRVNREIARRKLA